MTEKKSAARQGGEEQENRLYYRFKRFPAQGVFDAFQAGARFERQRIVDLLRLDPSHRNLYYTLLRSVRGVA